MPAIPASARTSAPASAALSRRGAAFCVLLALPAVAWGTFALAADTSEALRNLGGAVVLTVVALVATMRSHPPTRGRRAEGSGRGGLVDGSLVALAVLVIGGLAVAGEPSYIPAAVSAFLGVLGVRLAGRLAQPQYRWAGGLLVLAAAVGVAMLAAGRPADSAHAVVGIGGALVLWGAAATLVSQG